MYHPYLQTFITVADCGSFSKAAEKLYITTAAVMKQMNAFEEQLGFPLMKRSNHGTQLTKAGKSIYKDSRYMMQYAEESISRARKMAQIQQYVIRVGTSILNPCKVLMDLWGEVDNISHSFKMQIIPFEDNRDNILSTVQSIGRKFDFIVGPCGSNQWLSRCNFYELGTYKICCAVSHNHALADRKQLTLTDLYGEQLMMCRRGDCPQLDELRDYLNKEHPQITIEDTPSFYDIDVFNRCEETNCILLTLENWKDVHPFLVTLPVDWTHTMPYGLLYSKVLSKDAAKFLEVIKKNIL